MVGLADAYQRGDVIEHNEDEAMKLYRRAARMGNIVAIIMVGGTGEESCDTLGTQSSSVSNNVSTKVSSRNKLSVSHNLE